MTDSSTSGTPEPDPGEADTGEIDTSPRRRTRLWRRFGGGRRRTAWVNGGLAALLAVAVVLAFMIIGNPSAPPAPVRTAAVTRGDVTATVTGTGNAASQTAIPVSFQTDGTVTAVDVKAGDTITAGEVLATVDARASQESLRSGQASLDNALAAYRQEAAGPTDVKKQQDQQSVTEAQRNIDNARTVLANDNSSTDTNVKTARVQLSTDTRSQDTLVSNAEANVRSACTGVQLQAFVVALPSSTTTTTTPRTTTTPAATSTSTTTSRTTTPTTTTAPLTSSTGSSQGTSTSPSTSSSQDSCTSARQSLRQAQNTRDQTLSKDRLSITSAGQSQDTSLQNDQHNIQTAEGSLRDAQLTAQADLHPNTPDQIDQTKADVASAQVTVDTAQRNLDGTVLKAPIGGVVLEVDGKVGQNSSNVNGGSNNNGTSSTSSGTSATSSTNASTASANTSGEGFLAIANPSQLEVTADVAESDAANLQLGQKATVTFPATNDSATGTVTEIQPQSTVTNNVVLFPVEVSLDTAPTGVKTGSTASLDITKQTVTRVLQVPSAAITTTGTSHTVTVARGGATTVVPVGTGVTGTTNTEITSGLTEGDVVVLPTPNTAASPAPGGFPRLGGGR